MTAFVGFFGVRDRSEWTDYVKYDNEVKTVILFAGQTIPAGTVTFSDRQGSNGQCSVNVTIALNNDAQFDISFGMDGVQDDNVKIQDYAFAPTGNPSPGLFDHKRAVEAGQNTITVPVPCNNYYGVHADLRICTTTE